MALNYEPRFLLRYQDLGNGLQALEANGRPFLMFHTLDGQTDTLLAPRWRWTNRLSGQFGEQDIQSFLQSQNPAGQVDTSVIESQTFGVVSTLIGPLIGRNDFRTEARFQLSFQDPATGMSAAQSTASGDTLCFAEPDGPAEDSLAAIANTCQIGVGTGTIHNLTELDRLEIFAGYDIFDFDPGPFVHVIDASVLWRRTFTRTLELRTQLGGLLTFNARPRAEEDDFQPLPLLNLGLLWRLVDLRLFRLELDMLAGADGYAEPVSRRYLLRASATISLIATIQRDVSVAFRINGFTLGPEENCPPRQVAVAGLEASQCPDQLNEEILSAEITDLSSFASELSLTWRVDRQLNLMASGRYGFRGPHITRWGIDTGTANVSQSQREITAQVGLQVLFGTNNNLSL